MTLEEQLRIIERAYWATFEECYRPDLMEFLGEGPCLHCELRELAADLRARIGAAA